MSFSFLQTVQQLSQPLMSFGDQLFFHVSASSSSDTLIQDFAAIMIVAAIMLVITHRLKQPMVIGYLVAGMIIGPYTPPFRLIQNVNSLNTFAESRNNNVTLCYRDRIPNS